MLPESPRQARPFRLERHSASSHTESQMNGPEHIHHGLERVEVRELPPRSAEALQAYRKDLGQLLGEAPGQWVAYCGAERIGIGPTKAGLYHLCLGKGLARGEFLVRSIEPVLGEVLVGP